ncbi:MAG TPA: hypothetical protein VFJ49_02510 [Methyloceanibacter sp.]|nr:hypothetical protein [Methyloceanibacter sp.]
MQESEASWQTSAALRRIRSLLLANLLEEKLRNLERAVKANFNPNQPRVPRGNPDGGQWTGTGGGGGGGRTRIAQMPRGGGRIRSHAEGTPEQEARLVAEEAQAQEAIRRVREIDPNWSPKDSLTDPNSIEALDNGGSRGETIDDPGFVHGRSPRSTPRRRRPWRDAPER